MNPQIEKLAIGFWSDLRWERALERLKADGKLTDSKKDIGPAMQEIWEDFLTTKREEVRDALWAVFVRDIRRVILRGFPEFYEAYLNEMAAAVSAKEIDDKAAETPEDYACTCDQGPSYHQCRTAVLSPAESVPGVAGSAIAVSPRVAADPGVGATAAEGESQ